jgi:hypothetical protein
MTIAQYCENWAPRSDCIPINIHKIHQNLFWILEDNVKHVNHAMIALLCVSGYK